MEPEIQMPEKHFVNRVTPFSKTLALILFIGLPIFTLYFGYQAGIKNATKTTEDIATFTADIQQGMSSSTQPDNVGAHSSTTGELSHYEDVETRVAFDFPIEWGPVSTEDERGDCPVVTAQDPCNSRRYLFSHIDAGPIFLSVATPEYYKNLPARGPYWGDGAGALTSDSVDCANKSDCNIITNKNGVKIVKKKLLYQQEGDDGGQYFNFYYVYAPASPYHGLILSDQRISNRDPAIEKQFEDIVIQSLKLR